MRLPFIEIAGTHSIPRVNGVMSSRLEARFASTVASRQPASRSLQRAPLDLRFAACLRANRHVLAVGTMLGIEVEDDRVEILGDLLGNAGHGLDFLEARLAHAFDTAKVLEQLLATFGA